MYYLFTEISSFQTQYSLLINKNSLLYMYMMFFVVALFVPLFFIICLAGTCTYIFHKKSRFETILPLALMALSIFIFIFTVLFHNISAGVLVAVIFSLFFIPFSIFDKDRVKTFKEKIFTPGLVIFVILYVSLILLNWQRIVPMLSDTSMHWAPHVWTMWLRNDFYTSPTLSIVIHGDYPPMLQLFELILCKLTRTYSENILFVAIQIISFSMILPVFDRLKWGDKKNIYHTLLIFLLVLLIIFVPSMFFVSGFYSNLEVDTALSFIFAYGFYLSISESKKTTISGLLKISLCMTFLCLTKQIAILFALIIFVNYIINLYFFNYKEKDQKIGESLKSLISKQKRFIKDWHLNKKSIILFIFAIILPLFCVRAWSAQITNYRSPDNGVAIFHLNIKDIRQIPGILLKKTGTSSQQNFSRNYIKHVLFDPGGITLNYLGQISYFQIVIVFVGIILLMTLKFDYDRHLVFRSTIINVLGWCLYLFAIYSVFLFGGMNSIEQNSIDTPNRYLRTYLFSMNLIIIMALVRTILYKYSINNNTKNASLVINLVIVALILLGVFANKDTVSSFLGANSNNKAELSSYNIPNTVNSLNSIQHSTNDNFSNPLSILVEAKDDNERHYLQYKGLPNKVNLLLASNDETSICSQIKSNSYLIINFNDANVDERINNCLEEKANLTTNGVYKILNKNNKTIFLKKQENN